MEAEQKLSALKSAISDTIQKFYRACLRATTHFVFMDFETAGDLRRYVRKRIYTDRPGVTRLAEILADFPDAPLVEPEMETVERALFFLAESGDIVALVDHDKTGIVYQITAAGILAHERYLASARARAATSN